MYENKGDLTFEQITEDSGLPIDTFKSFGAVFGDFNRDGFLDLYYTERPFAGSGTVNRNRLFKNLGQNNFEEVTYEANVADEDRLPFCAAFFDYNDDKWPDIYIANDRKKRNTLLQNNQGVFTDVTDQCNAGVEIDAMNVGIGDIDNDGLNDIYVTNTPSGSALLKCGVNQDIQQIEFSEEAESRGVGFFGIGWGANFLDMDNDGWQDLYVSGMQIGSNVISSEAYLNDGTGYFDPVQNGFVGDTVTSFVNAIGDFDEDGYPDILVNNSQYFPSQLWTAQAGDNNWIKLNLRGIKSNRDGIGAKIELYGNDMYQMKYTHCGIAFMGQNSNTQLFGLAQNESIDSIKITWPTGHIDLITDPGINSIHDIVEGQTTNGEIFVDSDVTIISSVEDENVTFDMSINPNPVMDIIKLNLDGHSGKGLNYIITDLSGNIICNKTTLEGNIPVSHLISGMYILQINEKNSVLRSLKFIKL